jgi:hypothetical protein
MTTNQPVWKAIAQLGDVNPLEYGGLWILSDTTGAYAPEAEYLVPPEDDDARELTVYRYILERCTFTDGVLSDNKYHPAHPAWFADSIADVARYCGMTTDGMIAALCDESPVQRAGAYQAIGNYHGFDNLDSYPITLTRAEARARYRKAQYRVK